MRTATTSHTRRSLFRRGAVFAGIVLLVAGLWFLTTNDARVWPVRNTLHYRALMGWWGQVGGPSVNGAGTLQGTVADTDGRPIVGARVLVTQWDGTSFSAHSDAQGRYSIPDVPAGRYRPVAGAPGFEDVALDAVHIGDGAETVADIALNVAQPRPVPATSGFELGEQTTLSCDAPLPSRATRQPVRWRSAGQPNEPTFFYTPVTATVESKLGTLLAVYPGPADQWECVSVPLAAAGYAVLGAGPSYSLDLEGDVDELEQALGFVRQGRLPGADGERIAVLGGSYSTILTQRLMQRDHDLDAMVLLGPPTDLFDMRRRFEAGTFVPPFGLDQVLVALGLPSDEPLRYWQYSGAYHVRPDLPPLVIFHSRTDEVVPYQQSELLAATLREEGAAHELYLFEGASHYLLEGSEDALEIYRVTLEFLGRHLR